MKILKSTISSRQEAMKKTPSFYYKVFTTAIVLLVLASSCSDDNNNKDNAVSLACKNKPDQITFGNDKTDIVYDAQDKPVTVTTTVYNPLAPSAPPTISVYTIEYNTGNKAQKVSKSVNSQPELYYQLEYNAAGQLIKQSKYNLHNLLVEYTTAEYDNGVLKEVTTHQEDTSEEVTGTYTYENGLLVKKSLQNLYDVDSDEFYHADYTYSYFLQKENKINPYFEGPLGLLFISNLSNHSELQYLHDENSYQLFYAQETSLETKMLKKIEVIAFRYNTQDTTHVLYSYEYDADGFPTLQSGTYKNVTRRYVPTPVGSTALLVTPRNKTFGGTINFSCQ